MKTKQHFLTLTLLLAALLNCFGQPVITTEPQSRTNVPGMDATFAVVATGTEPLAYQWRLSAAGLVGKTNDTLIVTNVQTANAGSYTVVVTNREGAVTSVIATLTVVVPPTITKQPANQSVSLGAKVTFTVTATGTAPRYIQWRFNETNLPGETSTSLVVTNVQPANAGDYAVVVTNLAGSVTSQVAHLDVDPTFTKITTGRIVTDIGSGVGCAWGDYDNDGFMDLFITSSDDMNGTPQKNVLFHNNRDGTFTKVTNTVVTAEARDWRGGSWVDYDNDGNLDLFVTSVSGNVSGQNELFRNNADGTFTKMTKSNAGDIVSLASGDSEGPVWADYDNDGFVDVFIGRYGIDWLYHNDGGGFFSSVTNVLAGPVHDDSYGGVWGDYNNDGLPDLFVTVKSDPPANRFYLNSGGGTFTRVISGSIFTDHVHSFGCAWGDYDNDGYLDLFVAGGGYVGLEKNLLYHNDGDGTFARITNNAAGSIVSDTGHFNGCAWGDYDNDGFLDLFVTTAGDGVVTTTNSLYHNNGDGSFERIFTGSLVNDGEIFNSGSAWADYDNDGFLDLFVTRGVLYALESNLLYRNNGNSNGWVKIKLVGTMSNRSAIGAKVRLQARIRGRTFWQMREINTGSGFGAGPLEAHFGLGDATNIDAVRIEWPSGIVQELRNVAPKQFLTITEPPHLQVTGLGEFQFKSWSGMRFTVEASPTLTGWTPLSTVTNTTGTLRFADPDAANYQQRFYRVQPVAP